MRYSLGTTTAFDLTFEGDGLPCAGCRFDIELNGKVKYVEFKSYALNSIPNIPLPQFKNYLASVNSISEFNYVFNKLDTPNVADVKSKFKQVFNKDPEGVFASMKPELRESLGVEDLGQFKELINDLDSELYSFIEVK